MWLLSIIRVTTLHCRTNSKSSKKGKLWDNQEKSLFGAAVKQTQKASKSAKISKQVLMALLQAVAGTVWENIIFWWISAAVKTPSSMECWQMLVGSGLCVMSLCNSKQGSVIHFQRKHRGVILKSTEHWHFLRGQTSRSRAIHHRRTESIHGMNHKHRSYLSIFVLMALLTMNEIHISKSQVLDGK